MSSTTLAKNAVTAKRPYLLKRAWEDDLEVLARLETEFATYEQRVEWWTSALRPNSLERHIVDLRRKTGDVVIGVGVLRREDWLVSMGIADLVTPIDYRLQRIGVVPDLAFEVAFARFLRDEIFAIKGEATDFYVCCHCPCELLCCVPLTVCYLCGCWGTCCSCVRMRPCVPSCCNYSDEVQRNRMEVIMENKSRLEQLLHASFFPGAESVRIVQGPSVSGWETSLLFGALTAQRENFSRDMLDYDLCPPTSDSLLRFDLVPPTKLKSILILVKSPALGAASDPISWVLSDRLTDASLVLSEVEAPPDARKMHFERVRAVNEILYPPPVKVGAPLPTTMSRDTQLQTAVQAVPVDVVPPSIPVAQAVALPLDRDEPSSNFKPSA